MPDPRNRFAAMMPCLLFLAYGAASAGAGVCDDVDAVSERWLDVADALEEESGDKTAELDLARLERDVNVLLDPTERLGDGLVELGTPGEEALGNKLREMMAELREVETGDRALYLVDQIDDLVAALDDIVTYCDG